MAIVEYLFQGIDPARNHEDIIKELLNPAHNYNRVTIYSAFSRLESITCLKGELTAYGSKITAVIGIRNGITTIQALEALFDTGADLYVVDTGAPSPLFHPKTIIGINDIDKFANALVGSANCTPGGFRRNIENSCILRLHLSDPEDKAFVKSFLDAQNILLTTFDQDNVIHVTSKNILQNLFYEGRIVDENQVRTITNVGFDKGGNKIVKRMKIRSKKATQKPQKNKVAQPKTGAVILDGSIAATLTEVWKSGPLSERDLTIPKGKNTNPTGSMLLKKGKYDIDFQSYFRDTVFKDLSWTASNSDKPYFEYADAKFHFIIDGIEYHDYTLTIHYDTRTDTKSYIQRNGNTHLHWGDAKDLIKNKDLLGKTLFLYRMNGKNDEFVIEIKDINEDED